jgi:hypothetical protein
MQVLTEGFIFTISLPGEAHAEEGSLLDALITGFAVPLGLAARGGDRYEVRAEGPAIRAVIDYMERRDRSGHRTRPFECGELALFMLKSDIGLPGELFELVITALLRTGQLVAVGEDGAPVPWQQLATPIRQHVHFVPRPSQHAGVAGGGRLGAPCSALRLSAEPHDAEALWSSSRRDGYAASRNRGSPTAGLVSRLSQDGLPGETRRRWLR